MRDKAKSGDDKGARKKRPRFAREDLGHGKSVLAPVKTAKERREQVVDAETPLDLEEDNSFNPYDTAQFDRSAIWKKDSFKR